MEPHAIFWTDQATRAGVAPPAAAKAAYRAWVREAVPPGPPLGTWTVARQESSADGQTSKALLVDAAGTSIETVCMRHHHRTTVCVSTQAGCAFRCAFCATGLQGFGRHLGPTEILDQVLHWTHAGERVDHVVFMGMGEPFHHFQHTADALALLADEGGTAIAARRLTVSTVGLPLEIRRYAELPRRYRLALSLHAPDDALRARLMPVAARHPLAAVLAACQAYRAATRCHVLFAYTMLAGVNDADAQAEALATLLRPHEGHVNLIPYNATPATPFVGSPPERVRSFQAILRARGLAVTVRQPMGPDVAAACGQLRGRA